MLRYVRILAVIVITVLVCSCYSQELKKPKNIILFIGDGMGVSHVTAAKIVKGTLNLDRFKSIGLVTTHCDNNLVTDSAAAGTALATGHKTTKGTVSVDLSGRPLKTVVEYAEQKNMRSGLIATCTLTHATPACFVAHVDSRAKHAEIAEQIAATKIDLLLGGGWAYFVPSSEDSSRRTDDKNLLAQMKKRMFVTTSIDEVRRYNDKGPIAGFLAPVDPPAAHQRDFRLAELTGSAITLLSKNDNGFFLMVEGAQIDWAAHDGDAQRLVDEMIDFDDAIGIGLDFAETDHNTLVVVTADHETGGFSIHNGSVEEKQITGVGFTTGGHTANMVPIFSFGPGNSEFTGIIDNTKIGQVLIDFVKDR
jgi:alkaline phosphatase